MSNTIDLLRALDVNRPLVPNEYSTVLFLFFFSFHWNSTKERQDQALSNVIIEKKYSYLSVFKC